MREFELMPNEEQIRDMAMEYGKAKARRDMVASYTTTTAAITKLASSDKVTLLFCLNTDIDNALRRLYSLASKDNRETINRIIIMKKDIAKLIVTIGEIKSIASVGHQPYKAVSNSYGRLLRDITELQEAVLVATYQLRGTSAYQDICDGEVICGILASNLAAREVVH